MQAAIAESFRSWNDTNDENFRQILKMSTSKAFDSAIQPARGAIRELNSQLEEAQQTLLNITLLENELRALAIFPINLATAAQSSAIIFNNLIQTLLRDPNEPLMVTEAWVTNLKGEIETKIKILNENLVFANNQLQNLLKTKGSSSNKVPWSNNCLSDEEDQDSDSKLTKTSANYPTLAANQFLSHLGLGLSFSACFKRLICSRRNVQFNSRLGQWEEFI